MSDFIEDYRIKYMRWRNLLERDELNPSQCIKEITAEMSNYERELMDPEQKLLFINTHFPQYIKILLDKRFYAFHNPDYGYFLDFFSSVILFSLKHLRKENFGAFEVILKILNLDKNFYDRHYCPISYNLELELIQSFEKKYQKATEFYYPNHSKHVNALFGMILNFFGNNSGFQGLAEYIKTSPSMDSLTNFLNIFTNLDDVMPPKPFRDAMKAFYKEIVIVVQGYNDEELKVLQKHDLKSFFSHLDRMLDKKCKNEKIGKIIESCELELAFKMLMTKYLEKRIYGVTEIVNKITQAKNLDEDNERRSKGFYVYKNEYRESAKWMNSERLLSWIDSKDLINVIFGPTSHHEIIKRSMDLIKFMYTNSRFTQDHLKSVWEVAFSKHEAEREALLNLMQDLVPCLDTEDLQFLYEKVKLVPFGTIDGQILQLAKSFTRLNSFYRPPHRKYKSLSEKKEPEIKIYDIPLPVSAGEAIPLGTSEYSINIIHEEKTFEYSQILFYLWDLWQEPALQEGISNDIATQAMSILKDSLLNYFRSERMKFLVMCLNNIKDNSLVLWSCDIIRSILESYPSVSVHYSGMDSKSSVIKDLDRDHQFLNLLYKSLIQFKVLAIDKALELSTDESTSSSDEDTVSESRKRIHEDLFRSIKVGKEGSLNYVEEVKSRLEFIKYIYSNSSETLANTHVKILWDSFILNATSESESEGLFTWLTTSAHAWPNREMISDDLQVFIFTDLLLKLHPGSFTIAAFSCFERFFININKRFRLISNYGSDENIEVLDINLISIEALWEIMLQSRNDEVFQSSSSLMKRVYRGLKSCTLSIQEDFIRICMKYISNTVPAIIMDEASVTKISRCLMLIIDFIQDFENSSGTSHDTGNELHVTVRNQCKSADQTREFVVVLFSNMTWFQASSIISNRIGSSDRVVFLLRGNFIDKKQDNKTVEELGIDSSVKIIVNDDYGDDIEMIQSEGVPPPIDVQASLGNLKMIFEDINDDILRLALEKSDGQVEDAVTLLTEDGAIEKLQQQLDKARFKKRPVEIYRLSNILSNTQEYFNLLFELFSFGNIKLNTRILNLLSKIPVNEQILEELKSLEFRNDWNNLLDSRCVFKLLYSLQIVDSIIRQEDSELWRNRFLSLGGVKHIYQILIGFQEYGMDPKNTFEAQVLDFMLKIIRIYLHSSDTYYQVESIVDYPSLISCIINIIESVVDSIEETESVLASALSFLVIILAHNPNLLQEIYSKEVFYNLIAKCLLQSPQQAIREAIMTTVSTIAESTAYTPEGLMNPIYFFWNIVISNFPTDNSQNCEEFFILAAKLIYQLSIVPDDFIDKCIEFVFTREAIEDRHRGNQDKVLTGYLHIATVLLAKHPEKKHPMMLDYLYSSLFDLEVEMSNDSKPPPKFKHPQTRKTAFDVMLVLCIDNSEIADKLLDKLYIHHSTHKNAGSFDIENKSRATSGYVGLRNFGSTCYMNSLLQQIFMMEPIRNGILYAELLSDENLEDNLMYQMQTVLANLLESEKEFYEPHGFCQAFKGYDGQSINVRIQQDADEFLNLLFDKLEELLKGTEQASLLRNHIGGSLAHEIVSCENEYPYHGQREEQFFRISLDVKNKKSLHEALDLYIKDDMLEGDNKYFCDEYNAKITAKKRCLILSLANTVIIHLKRFEFDYSTMQRSKINDYCEFPMVINFKSWAKDLDKPDEYFDFELTGVLLHSGVADSGHYSSIIKNRHTQQWFKFDDRYVEPYNIENLKADCFGGETFYSWGAGSHCFAQTKNAYMLIYERKGYHSVPQEITMLSETRLTRLNYIRQKIKYENMDFLRDLLYFDQSYFELLKSFIPKYSFIPVIDYTTDLSDTKDSKEIMMLTKYFEEDESRAAVTREALQHSDKYLEIKETIEGQTEPEDQSLKLIKLGTLFAYEMLVRAKNYEAFKYWIKTLLDFYLNHIKASIWFLNFLLQNKEILSEILLECRDPEIRCEFSCFISKILQYCSNVEIDILLEKVDVVNLNVLPYSQYSGYNFYNLYTKRYRAVSARFIEHYLTEYLSEFKRNCRRIEDYLLILKDFAECGVKHKILLNEIGAIQDLINNANDCDKYNSFQETEEIFKLLGKLICFTRTYAIRESKNLPDYLDQDFADLDNHTESYLSEFHTKRSLINNYKIPAVESIILHLCWENIKVSSDYIEEFSSSLISNKYDYSKVVGHLKFLEKLLTIDDTVKLARVNEFLEVTTIRHSYSMPSRQTFFEQIQRSKDNSTSFVMNIIIWWSDLMKTEHIMESTKKHSPQFRWIVSETFPRPLGYMMHDYLNKGVNFEAEFKEALRKFRLELESESEESVEIELDRYRHQEAIPPFKEDGEENSTDSENP